MLASTVLIASLPAPRAGSNAFRNSRYILLGLQGYFIASILGRTPPERWRPLYSWLDRP